MNNESIIVLIAVCSAVFGFTAWVGLIAFPAWQSYSRIWQRVAAVFLSLYSVASFLVVGVALGALVVWLRAG